VRGEALYQELLWVHGLIRRDLGTVRELARAVTDGMAPADLEGAIRELETNGPLWQLKVNCLHWCRFVHGHHGLEDAALFPALRRTDPELGPLLDQLEYHHRDVASLLEELEAAVTALTTRDTPDARAETARILDALERLLLAHLELEEAGIGPAIRRWDT
jgi:Hemerythrin HHE cation binding domain